MAHTIYKLDNKKVPSVTTILGRFKNSQGLIIWANKIGLEGKKYHDEIGKAADVGTSLHELAELHILNQYYELPQDETVKNCFSKFLTWWEEFSDE
jgi:hypothetical protein|tara:strand:- start:866 stop:1153 length:288 start_codon:yes stop_codon:yes gene_type:complete